MVGYSSSSDEEEANEADTSNGAGGISSKRAESDAGGCDRFPARKKLKTETQLSKTRYMSVISTVLVVVNMYYYVT